MKSVLLASLLVITCMLGMKSYAFSQGPVSALKTTSLIATTKAMRDFNKRFAAIEDEKWYNYRRGYAAEFESDKVRFRVEYDKKGHWSGTEKDYTESKLDPNIRAIVKQVYYDYTISSVKEFILPDIFEIPVYFICIEDKNSFKNLCVYEDEIRVLEEFSKLPTP